jgi:N-acetylmuramoyl-L-alanine amidase
MTLAQLMRWSAGRWRNATATKLEALGAGVLILRNADEYVDRPVRYARANEFGADVLLSVHHIGSTDGSVNYSATFYTQPDDMPIAVLAYEKLSAALGTKNGMLWQDTFGMTAKPQMPSTLTEAWFITNDQMPERYLSEAHTRSRGTAVGEGWVAGTLVWLESQALTDAVLAFLEPDIDRSSGHK